MMLINHDFNGFISAMLHGFELLTIVFVIFLKSFNHSYFIALGSFCSLLIVFLSLQLTSIDRCTDDDYKLYIETETRIFFISPRMTLGHEVSICMLVQRHFAAT